MVSAIRHLGTIKHQKAASAGFLPLLKLALYYKNTFLKVTVRVLKVKESKVMPLSIVLYYGLLLCGTFCCVLYSQNRLSQFMGVVCRMVPQYICILTDVTCANVAEDLVSEIILD